MCGHALAWLHDVPHLVVDFLRIGNRIYLRGSSKRDTSASSATRE